jgi:GTP-binding protein YchF
MPSIALIGPPGGGKSTVFELLGGNASRSALKQGFNADRTMVGVPDPRFHQLSEMFQPKKRTPVQIEVLDIPGFDTSTDTKLRTVALGEIRKADALAIVLDLFQPGAAAHAVSQLRSTWEEIVFNDYAVAEKGVEGVEMAAKSKHNVDAERRHTFLLSLLPPLEAGQGIRSLALDEEGEKLVRQYGLVTRKPILVLANLAEESLAAGADTEPLPELRSFCESQGWAFFPLSARVEHEIAQLEPHDRSELLHAYHLTEPALHRFVRGAYAALDLVTFFTVGEDEVRGWTIRRGTPARRAAGTIHSDLERGFIRGEVIHCGLLIECGSMAEAKKRGILRLEGKDYPVQDGDILHVRFSV